jgi:hypothetical protein
MTYFIVHYFRQRPCKHATTYCPDGNTHFKCPRTRLHSRPLPPKIFGGGKFSTDFWWRTLAYILAHQLFLAACSLEKWRIRKYTNEY